MQILENIIKKSNNKIKTRIDWATNTQENNTNELEQWSTPPPPHPHLFCILLEGLNQLCAGLDGHHSVQDLVWAEQHLQDLGGTDPVKVKVNQHQDALPKKTNMCN